MIINTDKDFHQRYDNLARQNRDTQVVYNRYEQVCDIKRSSINQHYIDYTNLKEEKLKVVIPQELYSLADRGKLRISGKPYEIAVLLFCGKAHLVCLESKNTYFKDKAEIIYNPDVKNIKLISWRQEKFEEDYKLVMSTDFTEFHRKLESPSILVGGRKGYRVGDNYNLTFDSGDLTVNANLDAIKWYQVMDVWHTYEKLYAFLSGVLCLNNKDLVEISDKNRLTGHGFDAKLSFRHPVKIKDIE